MSKCFHAAMAILLVAPSLAQAAGRVELELVTGQGFSALDSRAWYELLKGLKVDSLRIRAARGGDKVQIETSGRARPIYRVTGMLTARNEMVVPGGKFTLRDGRRIAEWLSSLREHGPEGPGKGGLAATFGLDDETLSRVRRELSQRVGFSTRGADRGQAVARIAGQLDSRVTQERGTDEALREAGAVEEELDGLGAGTALADLLRPAGLALVPKPAGRGGVTYEIRSARGVEAAWPVGFSAEDQRREKAPELFETLEVQIDKGTPLADALAAIGARMKTPLLLDHNSLAAEGVDPKTATVFIPAAKLSYSLILRKALGQNRLKYQLRVDEADRPFLWITSFRTR